MRFLTDENVADNVGEWLRARGYEVFVARDVVARGSPDELLAFLIEVNGLIIVTHDNDFKQLRRTLPQGQRNRVTNGAGRISLSVPEARVVGRLEQVWDIVEFQYARAWSRNQRLVLTITLTGHHARDHVES
jgi:predicted nuclease of predicted toxin-antitoxin system